MSLPTITEHRQIIDLWPSVSDLARDVEFKYLDVWRWRKRNFIPAEWWQLVVEAARSRDLPVTYELLAITIRNKKTLKAPESATGTE